MNTVGYHVEVYCAMLWSLQQAGGDVTMYVQANETSNIEAVISGW